MAKRRESWALMQHLATLSPEPWMCMGNFNEIIEHGEKWGGARRARILIEDFRGAFEDCLLSDLGAKRPKFTWNNGRHGRDYTKERLDRVVASKKWCDFFPHAEVTVLANQASNHNPLILTFNVREGYGRSGKRPFRYESCWSKMECFRDVVKKGCWEKQHEGDPWTAIKRNLQS